MIADLVQGFALQSKNNNSTTPSGVVVRFRIKLDGQCPSRQVTGTPDRNRTCDLKSRSLALYPTELQTHIRSGNPLLVFL